MKFVHVDTPDPLRLSTPTPPPPARYNVYARQSEHALESVARTGALYALLAFVCQRFLVNSDWGARLMTDSRVLKLSRVAVVLVAVLTPALGRAQEPPAVPPEAERRQVVPFLEGTYVFLTVPHDSIRFEADIQPNFVISQNFSDKLVLEESGRTPRFAYSAVGTPRVRLRMFDARSAPVRTPSYMPKGTFTGMMFRREPTKNGGQGSRVGLWAGQITVGHHSNGQDGCLFTTDVLVGDECVGEPDLDQINRIDGSFSTNYVRIGGRYRREWLRDVSSDAQRKAGIEEQLGAKEFTIGVDYDRHFHTDERMAPFYGQNRFRLSLAGATYFRKVCRSRANGGVILFYVGEQPDTVGSFAVQLEGSCTFTDQGGWGLFVRYYHGQDYYNLGWVDSISRAMVGAHFEQDGFLRFVSRKAKDAADAERRRREAR